MNITMKFVFQVDTGSVSQYFNYPIFGSTLCQDLRRLRSRTNLRRCGPFKHFKFVVYKTSFILSSSYINLTIFFDTFICKFSTLFNYYSIIFIEASREAKGKCV